MSRIRNRTVGRGLFGMVVLAALAFGASQAAAAPATRNDGARACDPVRCNKACIIGGAEGGFCYAGYDCHCY